MAVGGGLIVVTDRWLQFKFRGKWDEWILHVHCRANTIFAFCLESCLDTSLPLVIRQRKLSSIYKRYLLKIQNTCAYRSSNIYICAGQTQQKCVSLECGQSAPTQGRLWNRFIILTIYPFSCHQFFVIHHMISSLMIPSNYNQYHYTSYIMYILHIHYHFMFVLHYKTFDIIITDLSSVAGKLCHLIGSWLGLFLQSTSILRGGRSCSTRLSSLWSLSSPFLHHHDHDCQ